MDNYVNFTGIYVMRHFETVGLIFMPYCEAISVPFFRRDVGLNRISAPAHTDLRGARSS